MPLGEMATLRATTALLSWPQARFSINRRLQMEEISRLRWHRTPRAKTPMPAPVLLRVRRCVK